MNGRMRVGGTPPRYRKLLVGLEEEPMGGVANLFDVAMVFAVALILAMFTALSVPELLIGAEDVTIVKNAGKPDMEVITKEGVEIERYRMTREEIGGTGRRLGIAYMLPNGDVVYVPSRAPEAPAPKKSPQR
jgi:hypothetical protein